MLQALIHVILADSKSFIEKTKKYLDVGELKAVPIDLKDLSDIVNKEAVQKSV